MPVHHGQVMIMSDIKPVATAGRRAAQVDVFP
jgi:hypothetical protein